MLTSFPPVQMRMTWPPADLGTAEILCMHAVGAYRDGREMDAAFSVTMLHHTNAVE